MASLTNESFAVLNRFNPWWRKDPLVDLPNWTRSAGKQLQHWIERPTTHRAVLLSGAKQTGKTTLLRQSINRLLVAGTPAANILYVNFDHPLFKLAGIEAVVEAWRQHEPKALGPEFVFLDEAHAVEGWDGWITDQVDANRNRRIVATSSTTPPVESSAPGQIHWHNIRVGTLSFYEYLQARRIDVLPLPKIKHLAELFAWPLTEFQRVRDLGRPYIGHFHEYLVRSGYPQAALGESIPNSQSIVRENCLGKAIRRDLASQFAVRRVHELEYAFLHLCQHDDGLLDLPVLCEKLAIKRPTAEHFLNLLEAGQLIHRLAPYGYGKEIQRARFKIYLADAGIAPALLLKGKGLLDDPQSLGIAAETAVFKHLFTRYQAQQAQFSYWRGNAGRAVDLIAQVGEQLLPFEFSYREKPHGAKNLKDLIDLLVQKKIERGYVVTKGPGDFGELPGVEKPAKIMRLPAAFACYWLGEVESNVS